MSKDSRVDIVQREVNSVLAQSKKYLNGIPNSCDISFPGQFSTTKKNSYEEWVSKLSSEEIQVAALRMSSILWGNIVVLPQICPNLSKCVHSHVCPFSDRPPVGKACPMEQAYIMDKMTKLKKQFDVEGVAETEFMLLNKLVELDLYDLRINSMMAKEETQKPLISRIAMVSADGVPIYQDDINPLFELKEKIGREKSKLLTILVGTPQERYKKAAALKEQGSDKISGLNDRLEKLVEQAEKKLKKIEEVEGEEEKIEENEEVKEKEPDNIEDEVYSEVLEEIEDFNFE